jgi:hypothetical protein
MGLSRKGWTIGGTALVAGLAAALFLLPARGIAADAADGRYVHDCCGTLELRGGEMIMGKAKPVGYAVERDEAGYYLLPETYVGTWEDRGFEIDGSRPPVKLRLDKFPSPRTVTLPALRGIHVLKRARPRPAGANGRRSTHGAART